MEEKLPYPAPRPLDADDFIFDGSSVISCTGSWIQSSNGKSPVAPPRPVVRYSSPATRHSSLPTHRSSLVVVGFPPRHQHAPRPPQHRWQIPEERSVGLECRPLLLAQSIFPAESGLLLEEGPEAGKSFVEEARERTQDVLVRRTHPGEPCPYGVQVGESVGLVQLMFGAGGVVSFVWIILGCVAAIR